MTPLPKYTHPGGPYTRTTWERPGRRALERGLGTVDGDEAESMYWLLEGLDRGDETNG